MSKPMLGMQFLKKIAVVARTDVVAESSPRLISFNYFVYG